MNNEYEYKMNMENVKDLTRGKISNVITSLAAPLIGASFVQMAYTMIDLLWLGRLGSAPVAAVGSAFFFTWFNQALSYTSKVGTEITVSQSIGAEDHPRAYAYASQGIWLAIALATLYGLIVLVAAPQLLSIFRLSPEITASGATYLRWMVPGMMAGFIVNTYASVYYATGDSKLPFRMIAVGLLANIVLDPLFIFGWAGLPALGTTGAAIASTLSQLLVLSLFVRRLYGRHSPLQPFRWFWRPKFSYVKRIARMGMPVSLQSMLFSMIGMALNSFVARFGHIGVAVYSLGSQIEAISWMTAGGFSTALSSFVGQNYGAQRYDRIRDGYRISLLLAGCFGLFASILFIFFPDFVFSLFMSEPETVAVGAIYLRIMGYSQLFMVIELVTAGGFNGLGKTSIPAYVGIIFNVLRIPLALVLIATALGLEGVWWSITLSSVLKGSVLMAWYWGHELRRLKINP